MVDPKAAYQMSFYCLDVLDGHFRHSDDVPLLWALIGRFTLIRTKSRSRGQCGSQEPGSRSQESCRNRQRSPHHALFIVSTLTTFTTDEYYIPRQRRSRHEVSSSTAAFAHYNSHQTTKELSIFNCWVYGGPGAHEILLESMSCPTTASEMEPASMTTVLRLNAVDDYARYGDAEGCEYPRRGERERAEVV